MTAYEPPKPIIVHPEVPWKSRSALYGCDWYRGYHEVVSAKNGRVSWTTPGWSITVENEHDMNIARALALAIGDKARLEILEAAWSLCNNGNKP